MSIEVNITPKSTKAEILYAYNELSTCHDAFRKTVVRKAQELAKEHDWCDVVNRGLISMGLADLLPNTFGVEQKETYRHRWERWEIGFADFDEATEEATNYRSSSVHSQRRAHEYRAQQTAISGDEGTRFVTIGATADIDAVVKNLRDSHQKLIEAAAKSAKPFVPSAYPKWRAVEYTPDGKIVRSVEITDGE